VIMSTICLRAKETRRAKSPSRIQAKTAALPTNYPNYNFEYVRI
jgi:hypothetical protein